MYVFLQIWIHYVFVLALDLHALLLAAGLGWTPCAGCMGAFRMPYDTYGAGWFCLQSAFSALYFCRGSRFVIRVGCRMNFKLRIRATGRSPCEQLDWKRFFGICSATSFLSQRLKVSGDPLAQFNSSIFSVWTGDCSFHLFDILRPKVGDPAACRQMWAAFARAA